MASGRVVRASRHRHRAAIRQGRKVRNVLAAKHSFPTSPSRSRQVNGVMSGAVRVRRIDRLSVDSRVRGRVFVSFTLFMNNE